MYPLGRAPRELAPADRFVTGLIDALTDCRTGRNVQMIRACGPMPRALVARATSGMADGRSPGSDSGVRSTPALEAAAETLEPRARRLWPDAFAGAWVDASATGVIYSIFVGFTDGAAIKVAQLAEGFPEPRLLRAVTFEHSMRELESRQKEMIEDRELARAGDLVLPGVPGARYDLGLDVRRNALIVVLEHVSSEAIAAFRNRYGQDVLVQEGPLAVPDG